MKESTKRISSRSSSTFANSKMTDYHLLVAKMYALLSSAERLKCGAVLVTPDNTRLLMCGYNGTLPKQSNVCEEDGRTKPEVIHAEQNVLASCARLGISTQDCILYCTHSPCVECAKLLISAGIRRVVFERHYRDPAGLQLLHDNGVICSRRIPNHNILEGVKYGIIPHRKH